ncbi:sigma-70 family RNA polymerase sigma factor [Rhodocytophaga rosea]|uniref:Sigma-70 family RNA polymerase sigma factor n=1 Tax=Rhodocytophaga rosea TaxID=2704465 RepID=A0A6C0GEP2_9BACT|nr:sigma-70 family RNA polymerase sigma factor [Rhodocytophaga rosea]QHT66243.1 sigma-70 family RNA polymerase sigma factor [Rhodocytophaga rosea]
MHLDEFKSKVFPLKNKLFRFARWFLHTNEDAEDMVQEVFVKLWTSRDNWQKYTSLEAVAMQMTKNMCLNKMKATKASMIDIGGQNLPDPLVAPDKELEMSHTVDLLLHIINLLPPQQRLVIQLREVEELELEEIAQIAGLTLNNVRATLSIARRRVREMYLNYERNEGG